MEGRFFTFEGGEGAGKTTLITRLYEALSQEGHHVIKTFEPGATLLGQKIRQWLLHEQTYSLDKESELLLFLADRVQHLKEMIIPQLDQGAIVLCDRFHDSTIAYQGHARGIGWEKVKSLCTIACPYVIPNKTFFLDISPLEGMKRAKKRSVIEDNMEKLDLSFHQKVYEGFKILVDLDPERISVIDATQDADQVFAIVWESIKKQIKQ